VDVRSGVPTAVSQPHLPSIRAVNQRRNTAAAAAAAGLLLLAAVIHATKTIWRHRSDADVNATPLSLYCPTPKIQVWRR